MIKPRKRKTNIQSKEKESKARNDKTMKKKEENGENKRPFKSWNFQRIKQAQRISAHTFKMPMK